MSENLPEVKTEAPVPIMVDDYRPPVLNLMDGDVISQVERVAAIMCQAKVTVPAHLVGSKGDCFAIALQAAAWGMSPFTVAQKTHLVKGTLGYEAQLVHAVILSSRLIRGRFTYEWGGGEGNSLKCRTGATVRGEAEITWGTWSHISKQTVQNSSLWKSDPAQQLAYLAVKKWARLYCPDVIAGVYTPDELQEFGDTAPVSLDDALGEQSSKGQEQAFDDALGESETEPFGANCINCPEENRLIAETACERCKSRKGCPAHPEPASQKAGLKSEGF